MKQSEPAEFTNENFFHIGHVLGEVLLYYGNLKTKKKL